MSTRGHALTIGMVEIYRNIVSAVGDVLGQPKRGVEGAELGVDFGRDSQVAVRPAQ
jgi:hypothetical protein